MAKKKKSKKHKSYRNAGPPRPRSPRGEDETSLTRIAYTAGGAGGVALAGAFLAHEGVSPKTIATALGVTGAALAWKAGAPAMRSVGAGAMSAAGAQLALLMIEDHDRKKAEGTTVVDASAPKRQSAQLPPGSLENALSRAQARLALSDRS